MNSQILFLSFLISILILQTNCESYSNREFKLGVGELVNLNTCTKITFRTGFKSAEFFVKQPQNIKGILFTNTEIQLDTCGSENLYDKCIENGNAQCSYTTDISSEIAYKSGYCAEQIYMYVQVVGDAQLYIDAEVTENLQKNVVCDKINDQDKFVKCASIPINQCKEQCWFDCVYLSCQENNTEQFGMCVPDFMDELQSQEFCQIQQGINGYQKIDNCNSYYNEAKAEVRDHPFILYITFGFMIWLFSIWFYNYKLEKDGVPPFPVFCCPEICYPRVRVYPQNFYFNHNNNNNDFENSMPQKANDNMKYADSGVQQDS